MSDDRSFMTGQDPRKVGELLLRTGIALGMPHAELAKHLRSSRRSVSRWTLEGTRLTRDQLLTLAELALRRDRALAAELAAIAGETLASLGLEEAPPARAPASFTPARLVDAVVCAAAEAGDVSPRAMRPALLAALRSARELGLTPDALEAVLGAAPPA